MWKKWQKVRNIFLLPFHGVLECPLKMSVALRQSHKGVLPRGMYQTCTFFNEYRWGPNQTPLCSIQRCLLTHQKEWSDLLLFPVQSGNYTRNINTRNLVVTSTCFAAFFFFSFYKKKIILIIQWRLKNLVDCPSDNFWSSSCLQTQNLQVSSVMSIRGCWNHELSAHCPTCLINDLWLETPFTWISHTLSACPAQGNVCGWLAHCLTWNIYFIKFRGSAIVPSWYCHVVLVCTCTILPELVPKVDICVLKVLFLVDF